MYYLSSFCQKGSCIIAVLKEGTGSSKHKCRILVDLAHRMHDRISEHMIVKTMTSD